MELGTFTPRPAATGDQFPAKEAVDRPLVVLVREHRTGIVTKFKPEGGEGVIVDVADVNTNEVYIDVLWMNGAIVDNLAPYVAQYVPIKLQWQASAKGGNSYIGVAALDDAELAAAQQWAQNNPNRFDTERVQRAAGSNTQQPAAAPAQPAAQVTPIPQQPAAPAVDPQVAALQAQLAALQNQAQAS